MMSNIDIPKVEDQSAKKVHNQSIYMQISKMPLYCAVCGIEQEIPRYAF